jgi:hypothetical protein
LVPHDLPERIVRTGAGSDRRLRLLLGPHDLTLDEGEVAEFDTRTPHWFGNPYDTPVEILSLFGPQGERLHVRARPSPVARGGDPS